MASNSLRVIPALFISSGVAGTLSMLFGCTSKALHGGIFVLLVGAISNPLMYIVSLVVGTVLGTILLIVFLGVGNKNSK